METFQINNHSELLLRISALKAEKRIQEENLKKTFITISKTFDLISILKGSNGLNSEFNIIKTGLTTAIDLIIDLVLGKNRSIKGFLSSVLVEKFSSLLINNNLGDIITFITHFLHWDKKTNLD